MRGVDCSFESGGEELNAFFVVIVFELDFDELGEHGCVLVASFGEVWVSSDFVVDVELALAVPGEVNGSGVDVEVHEEGNHFRLEVAVHIVNDDLGLFGIE